jgi:outer membrane protein OmpA-like peptidoglycan-associated protein
MVPRVPVPGGNIMRTVVGRTGFVLAGAILLLGTQGCLATRGWVREQIDPLEGRINDVDTKVANLHLERRFVLDMKQGATFGSGSAGLTRRARTEIDRFFKELEETNGTLGGAPGDRVFVVAGHTDSAGGSDANYELAQRRAERIAGYLVSEKGVEPFQVHAVSYGESKPLASNRRGVGRQQNRRIEILVYQEKVSPWERMITAFR